MKITAILFFIFIVSTYVSNAQTVSIPDPVFRSCLEKKYPSTLDTNKNLILSEAAKISGKFSCGHISMKNAEGLQYFTSIDDLDISYNTISFIPDLSALKKLQVLDVSDNQISEIQDMSTFSELRDLDLKNNKLKIFPDISKNNKLEILSAPTNFFDSIPELNLLTKLRILYVESNHLSKLPDLKNQLALTSLNAGNNELQFLPTLAHLKSLNSMNVSNNHLKEIPALPSGVGIRTLDFSNNDLSSLPDFTSMDSLKTVLLQHNNLSFKDFSILTKSKNYENVFQLVPQKRKVVGVAQEYKEGEAIVLKTGVDKGIAQVNYEWFCNGLLVAKVPNDSLFIENASFSNSGYYFAKITHPFFPDLVLETDSFFVKVNPCLTLTDFSTTVSSITCEKAGTVKIFSSNKVNKNFIYKLEGLGTKKQFISDKSEFSQLTEPYYRLSISVGQSCTKVYADSLEIPIDHCDDPYISPDGDGVNDTYFFAGKGKAVFSDKYGNIVHKLELPEEWNGTNAQGIVSPGLYLVNINNGEQVIKISVVY